MIVMTMLMPMMKEVMMSINENYCAKLSELFISCIISCCCLAERSQMKSGCSIYALYKGLFGKDMIQNPVPTSADPNQRRVPVTGGSSWKLFSGCVKEDFKVPFWGSP